MDKIPEFTDDLNIISRLSDNPNTGDKLEPPQLKAKFDEAGLAIQKFLNEVLVPAINNWKPGDNSGADSEILVYGVSDAFRIYDAVLSGRPVYCLYENQYYLPLISWNEETETAVFSNSFVQCQAVAGEWSGNPVTEDSIEPEVFVGTENTTVAEFNEAFASGKPCFLMKATAGSGITMWVAYSCGTNLAYFYRIAPDGSVQFGTLDSNGNFTYSTAGTSGSGESNVFIGNNDTTLAEFKAAYDSGKTCFLRRSSPSGDVTYTAYNVTSTNAFFFAINPTGAIVYAYLDSSNAFTVQERKHVTTIDQNSTDDQIPTAKAVYDSVKGKLDATALPTAVNDALAQAKESGDFDGADGAPGYTPIRGKDYWTDADKTEMVAAVIAALPVYDGEVV